MTKVPTYRNNNNNKSISVSQQQQQQKYLGNTTTQHNNFQLNELSSVLLLLQGEEQLPRYPGLTRGLVAVLLYYDGRCELANDVVEIEYVLMTGGSTVEL